MIRVCKDSGYTTMLGTSFYDREKELEHLLKLLESSRTIIVYGPRNVGKSELVRYFLSVYSKGVWERVHSVVIDVRRRVATSYGLGVELRDVITRLERLLAEIVHVPLSLVEIVEAIAENLQSRRAQLTIIYVDEFHLLYSDAHEAIRDLEAIAGLLAKKGEEKTRLLLTVSEGFAATSSLRRRLLGYATSFMLVEPLDKPSMRSIYEEYRGKHGCLIDFEHYWSIYGGSPGYIPEACSHTVEDLLRQRIPEVLHDAVDEAIDSLAAKLGSPREVIVKDAVRIIEWIMERRLPPRLDPHLKRVAEMLVEYNILYPCRLKVGDAFIEAYVPQLPVYAAALYLASRRGKDVVAEVKPEELERTLLEKEWQVRCRDLIQLAHGG